MREDVEPDDLAQPVVRQRDERAWVARASVRDDEADVLAVRAFDHGVEGSVAGEVDRQDARLDPVLRRQSGGDLL